MHTSSTLALVAFSSYVSGHALITAIHGANNVTMPGLSVADGVPRDCPDPACGSEADTTVFQGDSPLGFTNGFGTVDPSTNIEIFMSGTASSAAQAASNNQDAGFSGFGGKKTRRQTKRAKDCHDGAAGKKAKRQFSLGSLFGGGSSGGSSGGSGSSTGGSSGGSSSSTGGGGSSLFGFGGSGSSGNDAQGTETPSGTKETLVGSTAGQGGKSGLPTASEDGTVAVTLHQVNQDGAGPFSASVDSTSGGQDENAFEDADVIDNVAGTSFGSISAVTTTDFPVNVQIPQGTVCSGTVGSAKNVCILRMKNNALAGPFGGSVAFTQSSASQKRALEFQRLKRMRAARI